MTQRFLKEEIKAVGHNNSTMNLQTLRKKAHKLAVLLKHGWRLRGAQKRLRASGLFDDEYYVRAHPEVAAYGGGALLHYLVYGSREGRSPHVLFDERGYRATHPEVDQEGGIALLHYLDHDDYNPNQWFDGKWYKMKYPDVSASELSPLTHYVAFGAAEGRDPSPRFSTTFYRRMNEDVAASEINPLAHFIQFGLAEGRMPVPPGHRAVEGRPVDLTEIYCIKSAAPSSQVALFVAHSPDGRLKPHVPAYLHALQLSGISVTLLVAADRPFEADESLLTQVSGLYVRRNEGLDFAAWAHVLRLERSYYDAEVLYLLNDSLIGPFNQQDLDTVVKRVNASPADVLGMTENYERAGWHLQSYFLALKAPALRSVAFQRFVLDVQTLDNKDDVINQYELRLAPTLKQAGLQCDALFVSPGVSNPTIYRWQTLIDLGFPFIKVMTLRDRFDGVDIENWREVLTRRGYDVGLAERTLAETKNPIKPDFDTPLVRASGIGDETIRKLAFISPFNYDNGLGAAGRSYISALRHTGLQLNLHPVKAPFHVHRQLCPPLDVRDFVGPSDVAVVHLNPEGWASVLSREQRQIIDAARHRVGLWVWETEDIPRSWNSAIERVDSIWVPSEFCANAFRAITSKPIHVIPHVVAPKDEEVVRSHLAHRDKTILYIFDGSSYLTRKNPGALVRAFAAARLADRGWKLVLKTKHLKAADTAVEALRRLVAATDGAELIDRNMSRSELRRLNDTAAIYASPHSSEGFGLTIAEAMADGKLVVATDYGGCTDFLDSSCGFPVSCTLFTLTTTEGAYEKGSRWAKVDELDLARQLSRAADAHEHHDGSFGQRAMARVAERLSVAAVCADIRRALATR